MLFFSCSDTSRASPPPDVVAIALCVGGGEWRPHTDDGEWPAEMCKRGAATIDTRCF